MKKVTPKPSKDKLKNELFEQIISKKFSFVDEITDVDDFVFDDNGLNYKIDKGKGYSVRIWNFFTFRWEESGHFASLVPKGNNPNSTVFFYKEKDGWHGVLHTRRYYGFEDTKTNLF